jgi:hypothetical protein
MIVLLSGQGCMSVLSRLAVVLYRAVVLNLLVPLALFSNTNSYVSIK